MLQRGRKSSSGSVLVGLPVLRLEAPDHLPEAEAEVWRSIVNAKPSDWFDAGNESLLFSYCGHAVEERRLSQLLAGFKTEWLEEKDGLARYRELSKLRAQESKALIALSRQMRLGQQQVYRNDAAKVAVKSGPQKPWVRRAANLISNG